MFAISFSLASFDWLMTLTPHWSSTIFAFYTFAGVLVGGIYGLRLGRVYFGESMFSLERDASKAALAGLVRQCLADGTEMIDCQLPSAHLRSLGSRPLPRQEFLSRLQQALLPDRA